MDVLLAGMNIDKTQLDEISDLFQRIVKHLVEESGSHKHAQHLCDMISRLIDRNSLTPETLSAAYARISRDPRPVDQLREDARLQVGKARRSNRTIIFGLGHASVAEHAVFNLDVIGVSRYLSEILQSHRLCSFTEKSQRYIRLDQDFFIPESIRNSSLETSYIQFVKQRFEDYRKLTDLLEKDLKHDPSLSAEDARYVLPLCTTTQMGMTLNARNLEMILQQAASSDSEEYKTFGRQLFSVIDGVAPSVIKYTQAAETERDTIRFIRNFSVEKTVYPSANTHEAVRLLYSTPNGDRLVADAIMARVAGLPFLYAENDVHSKHTDQIHGFFKELFRFMKPWDSAPREFEFADFLFEIHVSAAAYAQLKRHRMMTMSASPYNPYSDITVPPAMTGTLCEDILYQASKESRTMFELLLESSQELSPYCILGCHQRRVVLKINARELIHLSRLREDEHAQWDIRLLTSSMIELARHEMPGCLSLACGKNNFEKHRQLMGL